MPNFQSLSKTFFLLLFTSPLFLSYELLSAGEPVKGFKPSAQQKFFDDDSAWTPLWEEGEFTEGPAVAENGTIYFSDIGNRTMKYDPATKKTSVFREPSGRGNGIFIHKNGDIFICEGARLGGGRQLSVVKPSGEHKVVVDRFRGKKLNSPNDLIVCPSGNIFFTDPRYAGDEPLELKFQGVFRVSAQGKIRVATKELTRPNGILVNDDETRAFVAENHPEQDRHLVAFDVDKKGKFTNKKVLFDFGTVRGIDGMAFGPNGNIFATAGNGTHSGIYVFSPSGKALAFKATPGPPTNCTFGRGKNSKRLYLTSESGKPEKKYGLYFLDVQ